MWWLIGNPFPHLYGNESEGCDGSLEIHFNTSLQMNLRDVVAHWKPLPYIFSKMNLRDAVAHWKPLPYIFSKTNLRDAVAH